MFVSIFSACASHGGRVNRVSLFNLDVQFLVIFGLRGTRQDQECRRALECGYTIKKKCERITGVRTLGLGITTGTLITIPLLSID